ncbi:penicillin-binding protein 1C [Treponema sp.]|uniref:penicillin-binding protein 1C n=1 Tax=Treponema sp. TaxID=166 RepID=UPI003F05B72E
MQFHLNKKFIFPAGILAGLFLYTAAWILSGKLLAVKSPYSVAVYDRDGILTGASAADDGQWRFEKGAVPPKFEACILAFEDRRFYFHSGIDYPALARAVFQNIKKGRIVSGGSTITMQTARLLQGNRKRTYFQKAKEAAIAILLEARFTKKTILELYAANAPFGGNVVGIEAAAWRYFNVPPESLTWAECATLAVLPNQPSLVSPGKNSSILLQKRNRLLAKLYETKKISAETLELSLQEKIPGKPYKLPAFAPHYLEFLKKQNPGQSKFFTDLDNRIQKNTAETTERFSENFSKLGISNASAIVIETSTGKILAYIGNTGMNGRNTENADVDMIQAQRSTGSLLKPFLFAAMLDSGMLLSNQLVIDVPTRIGNYMPENNIPKYTGAIPASQALSRSLNIPAIRELRKFGITPFLEVLRQCGLTTFTKDADYYGLPLILGGGETTLIQITSAYASLMKKAEGMEAQNPFSSGSCYQTLEALSMGTRPEEESQWQKFGSQKKIAWKTGTSTGYRDAWCIGTTREFTVGVWVGNSNGRGNKNLTSASTAAPLMFTLFSSLPQTSFCEAPNWNLEPVTVCKKSGFIASENCEETEHSLKPRTAPMSSICPYCKVYSFTPDGKFQATAEDLTGIYKGQLPLLKKYFVLPPYVEYWYTKTSLNYKRLPKFVSWHTQDSEVSFQIVFPENNSHIIIPTEIDAKKGSTVFQAAPKNPDDILYWDLDGKFTAQTKFLHTVSVTPEYGKHRLTVTDKNGYSQERIFFIENPD